MSQVAQGASFSGSGDGSSEVIANIADNTIIKKDDKSIVTVGKVTVASGSFTAPVWTVTPKSNAGYTVNEVVTLAFTSNTQMAVTSSNVGGTTGHAVTGSEFSNSTTGLDFELAADALYAAADTIKLNVQTQSPAISLKNGTILLNQAVIPLALTLAAPIAGTDDAKILNITSLTAVAHTITGKWNGSGSTQTLTWGGAIGDTATLKAYNGSWYLIDKVNISIV